ncbi:MAG TPA: diaminopimelate epimerase [Longimicrobiales bacterium]|nr:diaminopimelate epimerase [Longimicrobiales bacterium]
MTDDREGRGDVAFSKGHGLGNDYLVVDNAALPAPLTPGRARLLCDRHRGVGSDGVLLADLAHDIALRIINPDGTEAEKSGNGLRIFGAWLYDTGRVALDQWFQVRLIRDTVRMRVEQELAHGALRIRVEIGRASFRGADVGFRPSAGETLDYELALPQGGTARVNTVSLSNPHCVVFVDRLERDDFVRRAPQLCTHPEFTAGTNVQFARVAGANAIEVWIWERGAGETLASGSSASAVCAAAVKRGFIAPGEIEVRMAGGVARVEVRPDYTVVLVAPAQLVFSGVLEPGLRQAFLDG